MKEGIDCICEVCGLEFTWILDGVKGPYDEGCCSDMCVNIKEKGGLDEQAS